MPVTNLTNKWLEEISDSEQKISFGITAKGLDEPMNTYSIYTSHGNKSTFGGLFK